MDFEKAMLGVVILWSDMGTTHLLGVCQAPDEPVKNVVGQRPQREVSHNGLHHLRVSLRETLPLCFFCEFLLDVLSQK